MKRGIQIVEVIYSGCSEEETGWEQ